MSEWGSLVAFALLTAANAFFVAAEFSLVTVDRAGIDQRAAAGDSRAIHVRKALRTLSFQLSGAQFGITVSALLTGFLAEPALSHVLRPVLTLIPGVEGSATAVTAVGALITATLLSMLFGELIPKNAALAKPLPVAMWAAAPQRAFSAVFSLIIRALNGSANWVVRRLGIEPQEELASARSPEELGLLAALSAKAGELAPDIAMLLQRTIRFGDKRAAEVMTPRVDVVALEATTTVKDLLELSRHTGHTRFPVYLDTLDHIVGVANVVDALRVPAGQRDAMLARAIAREPVLVPESLDLDSVLAALSAARSELAIVIDEYGGTDGIVTREDLAEELVGEIDDEYDQPTPVPDSGLKLFSDPIGGEVSGLLREDELAEHTGFHLPQGPFETLAGFLMSLAGRIPVEGDEFEYQGWVFRVVTVTGHRLERVEVMPPPADKDQLLTSPHSELGNSAVKDSVQGRS